MINSMTCLNGVGENGEGENFVEKFLSYLDDKIKSDKYNLKNKQKNT